MHSREAASTHWTSSTTARTGRRRAAARSTPSVATHTASRSPGAGGPSASAPDRAAACGCGSAERSAATGASRSDRAEKVSSTSVSAPQARSTVTVSPQHPASSSSSVVLPIPASPCTSSALPCPRRSADTSSLSGTSSAPRSTIIPRLRASAMAVTPDMDSPPQDPPSCCSSAAGRRPDTASGRGRLDVLVDPEEIARVVAPLDLRQPVVIAAAGRLDPVLAFFQQTMAIWR